MAKDCASGSTVGIDSALTGLCSTSQEACGRLFTSASSRIPVQFDFLIAVLSRVLLQGSRAAGCSKQAVFPLFFFIRIGHFLRR